MVWRAGPRGEQAQQLLSDSHPGHSRPSTMAPSPLPPHHSLPDSQCHGHTGWLAVQSLVILLSLRASCSICLGCSYAPPPSLSVGGHLLLAEDLAQAITPPLLHDVPCVPWLTVSWKSKHFQIPPGEGLSHSITRTPLEWSANSSVLFTALRASGGQRPRSQQGSEHMADAQEMLAQWTDET